MTSPSKVDPTSLNSRNLSLTRRRPHTLCRYSTGQTSAGLKGGSHTGTFEHLLGLVFPAPYPYAKQTQAYKHREVGLWFRDGRSIEDCVGIQRHCAI